MLYTKHPQLCGLKFPKTTLIAYWLPYKSQFKTN